MFLTGVHHLQVEKGGGVGGEGTKKRKYIIKIITKLHSGSVRRGVSEGSTTCGSDFILNYSFIHFMVLFLI